MAGTPDYGMAVAASAASGLLSDGAGQVSKSFPVLAFDRYGSGLTVGGSRVGS
jgi:hypothetical protein